MTEAEWIACEDPTPMLEFLRGRASDWKLRLFACACCRNVWQWLSDERSRNGVEVAERFGENSGWLSELNVAYENALGAMEDASGDSESGDLGHTRWHAATAAVYCTTLPIRWDHARDASQEARQSESCYLFESTNIGVAVPFPEPEASDGSAHAGLLRDIFGNPFRPAALDPAWRTPTAVALASQMYGSRDFSAMPILADALQDAGCDSAEVLDHCRGPGPHVRGCWVVDLVLGKA